MQITVAFKGTLDSTEYTVNSDSTVTLLGGYYDGDATDLYQQGYTDGYAQKTNGTIIYSYHYHTSSCYQTGTCTITYYEATIDGKTWKMQHHSSCGKADVGLDWKTSDSPYISGNGLPNTETHTYSKQICGYSEGQIVSATITY